MPNSPAISYESTIGDENANPQHFLRARARVPPLFSYQIHNSIGYGTLIHQHAISLPFLLLAQSGRGEHLFSMTFLSCGYLAALCVLHKAICSFYPTLCVLHKALRTPHSALRTPHNVLRNASQQPPRPSHPPHSAPRVPRPASRTSRPTGPGVAWGGGVGVVPRGGGVGVVPRLHMQGPCQARGAGFVPCGVASRCVDSKGVGKMYCILPHKPGDPFSAIILHTHTV
jgi:hypothetical protein